jgi:hypothetical protein
MWRMICKNVQPTVTFDPPVADAETGSGTWRAKYPYGKTATKPGRPVDNNLYSTFKFRDGLIIDHRDACDVEEWARQAFPFPVNHVVSSSPWLRRFIARGKLKGF